YTLSSLMTTNMQKGPFREPWRRHGKWRRLHAKVHAIISYTPLSLVRSSRRGRLSSRKDISLQCACVSAVAKIYINFDPRRI
uniref:Protein kinase domain-containing protein n=1 Tax=Parascaris univalens TaxID=6257 RepID=A0A915A8R6_PARUN